jgi:hypothetical protein
MVYVNSEVQIDKALYDLIDADRHAADGDLLDVAAIIFHKFRLRRDQQKRFLIGRHLYEKMFAEKEDARIQVPDCSGPACTLAAREILDADFDSTDARALTAIMIMRKAGRRPSRCLQCHADERNVPYGGFSLDLARLPRPDGDVGDLGVHSDVARLQIDDLARPAAGFDQQVGYELQLSPDTDQGARRQDPASDPFIRKGRHVCA